MEFAALFAVIGAVVGAATTAWGARQAKRSADEARSEAHEMAQRLRVYREQRNLTPGQALSIGAVEAFAGDASNSDAANAESPPGSDS